MYLDTHLYSTSDFHAYTHFRFATVHQRLTYIYPVEGPVLVSLSLVPRPLPDFISQPWRKCEIKSGSGLGTRLGKPKITVLIQSVGIPCSQWL